MRSSEPCKIFLSDLDLNGKLLQPTHGLPHLEPFRKIESRNAVISDRMSLIQMRIQRSTWKGTRVLLLPTYSARLCCTLASFRFSAEIGEVDFPFSWLAVSSTLEVEFSLHLLLGCTSRFGNLFWVSAVRLRAITAPRLSTRGAHP